MRAFLSKAILPATVSAFESDYVGRVNRIALWFFLAHLPVFVAIAYLL